MNEGDQGPGGSDLSGENFGDYSGPSGSGPGGSDTRNENWSDYASGYGLNDAIPGLGPSQTGPMHSPGLSYATLNVLNDIGLGKMGIPGFTQNVEQALAAQNVHNVLNYAAPALASLVPGYGTVSALGKGIANIHGLMTGRLSAEEVVPGLAAGLIGARTGIPSGILEGIFTNDLGKAVGSGAQAGLGALVGGLTGNPLAGALASSTLGSAVGRAASEAVGGTKSGGPGGLFGGAGVPSTSSAPTGNTYGDTGINADTYAVLAAIEQAAQEPKQPAWSSQMTAGRYGPLMEYEFGA